MDNSDHSCKITPTNPTPLPSKSLRRSKNDQKWEGHKPEIYRLYIEENNTLPETMRLIEQRHGFRASLRKWKDKMRNEWHFEKNFASKDVQVLLAKAEKRAREGKETVFFHAGTLIHPERLENFKKRKIVNEGGVSPSADTPENFTYDSPLPEEDEDVDAAEYGGSRNRDVSTSSSVIGQDVVNTVDSVEHFEGVDSHNDDEEWVNLVTEEEISQDYLQLDASATPPSSQTPELPVSPQATDRSSSQSPSQPQSVSLQELNVYPTPPLEVRSMAAMAEEARINSVTWKGTRRITDASTTNTPQAELEYSPTTISPTNGRTIRCLALQNLTRVAESHKQQGRLSEAANAYRQVIAGYEKAEGDFAGPILTICRSLAIILKVQRDWEQAETVLVYAFCLCLQKAQADPPSTMALAMVLGRPLPIHISDIVAFLEEIYSDQSDIERKLSLAELRKALRHWNGGPLNFHYPHIWFAITRLASAYSAKGKEESAGLLFRFTIPNLRSFDDILYATKKANGYLGYSLHLQRQQRWEKSARMLMLALENVTQIGDQGMIPRDDYEPLIELLYSHWNGLLQELKERNVDEELVKPMRDLIESKRAQLDHQQQSLEVTVSEMSSLEISRGNSWRNSWRRLATLTEASERDGVSSLSSRSYKYGITYSGSSLTGVSELFP